MKYIQISKFKVREHKNHLMSVLIEWFDLETQTKEIEEVAIEKQPCTTAEEITDICYLVLGDNYEIIDLEV